MKRIPWLMSLIGLLALGVTACGDDNVSGSGDDDPNNAPHLNIEILGKTDYLLNFDSTQKLAVRATYDNGEPAEGEMIHFTIEGNGQGSIMSTSSVPADDQGIATNDLLTGIQIAQFKVEVNSDNSNKVTFNVTVDGTQLGKLQVLYNPYEGNIPLNSLTTRVHPNVYNCDGGIDWNNLPPWDEEKVAPSRRSVALFEHLLKDKQYTVTVSALGPAGTEVARGCATTEAIQGERTIRVEVPMILLPIQIEGEYEIATELNIQESLPGETGWDGLTDGSPAAIVQQVTMLFSNPGEFVFWWVDTGVQLIPGVDASIVDDIIQGALESALVTAYCDANNGDPDGEPVGITPDGKRDCRCNRTPTNDQDDWPQSCTNKEVNEYDVVNMAIVDHSPAWVQNIFQVGDSVTTLLSNIEVGGKLDLQNANEVQTDHFDIDGTITWERYMFTWKFNQCDVGSEDPCCGRMVFGEGEQGLQPSSANFEGTLVRDMNYDSETIYNVQLGEHSLSLRWGNILAYLIKYTILPAITTDLVRPDGGVNLGDFVAKIMPVETFACGLHAVTGNDYKTCTENCEITFQVNDTGEARWNPTNCPGTTSAIISVASFAGNELDKFMNTLTVSGNDKYNFYMYSDDSIVGLNTLRDADQDLRMDTFEVEMIGTVQFGEDANSNVDVFAGMTGDQARDHCDGDKECQGTTSCQLMKGILDECIPRKVCLPQQGTRSGGALCNSNNTCSSGWCMPQDNDKPEFATRMCYAACESNADCESGFHCSEETVEYDFVDDNETPQDSSDDIVYTSTVHACTNRNP